MSSHPSHLSERQIEGFRQRVLQPAELLEVDDHLAACRECRLRVAEREVLGGALTAWEELEGHAGSASASHSPGDVRSPWRLAALAACAAVLVAAAVWLAFLVLDRPGPGVELIDSGQLASLPPDLRQAVAAALRTERIDRPQVVADLAGLGGTGSVLRGPAAEPAFVPLSPLATAVLDGRPTFRWAPLPAVAAYRVQVFDTELHPVADSGTLAAITQWRPGRPLPAGAVYAWQITARRGGEELTAPDPRSPPALFRVLAADRAAAVESTVRVAGGSHLVRGVCFAQAGLADDAEGELLQVVAANPHSRAARRLLASVRSWRPAQSSGFQVPSPTSTKPAQ